MSKSDSPITPLFSREQYLAAEVDSIISMAEKRECHRYSTLFFKKAKEATHKGDEVASRIFHSLGQATSLHLRDENPNEPFGPMAVIDGYRSAIVDDFTPEQIAAFKAVVRDIEDPELRARVADILWVSSRDYESAMLAIEAYLLSASNLEDPEHWTSCYRRIQRALRLAAGLGRGGEEAFKKVINHIEGLLQRLAEKDPLFLSCRLMGLLIEFKQGDVGKYAALAGKIAARAEKENAPYRARAYWETKAQWHELEGAKKEAKEARVRAAETYVQEADNAGSNLAAASFIQQAISAYRNIGGHQSRTDGLYEKLLGFQKGIRNEMGVVSAEVDLTQTVNAAIEHVKGKELNEALVALALVSSPLDQQKIEDEVRELAQKFPLQFIVSGSLVDEEGKVIAKLPSMMTDDSEEAAKAVYVNAVRQACQHYSLIARACIDPARRQVSLEHRITVEDLIPHLRNNELVRPGREYLVAKGLVAGLHGEWDLAAHLLIPQFEDSARFLLQQRGLGQVVSGMDSHGEQDDRSLNKTLRESALEEIFGKDLAFNLRALLVERFGANLRNSVAHGLFGSGSFFSGEVVFLWWLLLRLYLWPLIVQSYRSEVENKQESEGE